MIARTDPNQDSNEDVDQLRDGAGFVHLHVHSSYSLREGAMSVAKLAKLAAADFMPALAITDRGGVYGAVRFLQACRKVGVKALIGSTPKRMYVCTGCIKSGKIVKAG